MAASVAVGGAGVWTGSVWLTTPEAETAPYTVQKMLAAGSRDTVRSKGRTGKRSRRLRSAWTEAWEGPDNLGGLPMPLQSMISEESLRRADGLAEKGDKGCAGDRHVLGRPGRRADEQVQARPVRSCASSPRTTWRRSNASSAPATRDRQHPAGAAGDHPMGIRISGCAVRTIRTYRQRGPTDQDGRRRMLHWKRPSQTTVSLWS